MFSSIKDSLITNMTTRKVFIKDRQLDYLYTMLYQLLRVQPHKYFSQRCSMSAINIGLEKFQKLDFIIR